MPPPPSSTAPQLSATQLRSLLDILVHFETYAEVASFKDPDTINHYGYPFVAAEGERPDKSATPLLQLLLNDFVLRAPGFRDLPVDFWGVQFREIMVRFGDADLSESYDKGSIGTRKRLGTAASVIHEAVTRGLLAGIQQGDSADLHKPYDLSSAAQLNAAFNDAVHGLVYGDLADDLFRHIEKTNDFESHSPAIKAAVDYATIHVATFLHYVFVLSSDGPYLLKLMENVHSLIPYSVIGQTLRVGNAATMMNGIFRLVLAKISVGAITNWIGLTSNAADGMNLLQRIISMTLEWDANDFRKASERIKKTKDPELEKALTFLDQHIQSERSEHESVRDTSREQQASIVVSILTTHDEKVASSLTEAQHKLCLEYYAAQLSIRDIKKIIDVTCRDSPDLLTPLIKATLQAFEPMIRMVHQSVDLRKHLSSLEKLLRDLIETSKPKGANGSAAPPSVDDFVALLRRNRYRLFDYFTDVAQGCPDLRETWREWANRAVESFRMQPTEPTSGDLGAGSMGKQLQELFTRIPSNQHSEALAAIDSHARYLSSLELESLERMQNILDQSTDEEHKQKNMRGPGLYLSQWQSLMDSTLITPGQKQGPIRCGRDVRRIKALGKTGAISDQDAWDPIALLEQEEKTLPQAPDVSVIIDHLSSDFRNLVADISQQRILQE